jgi:hypothetical protein
MPGSMLPGGYPVAPDPGLTHRLGGFEIERTPSRMPTRLPDSPPRHVRDDDEEDEVDLPTAVSRLFAAKGRPFAVSCRCAI